MSGIGDDDVIINENRWCGRPEADMATPKKVAAYEAAKPASEFDPQNRDENIDYYIAKLDDLVRKFSGITAEATAPKQESLFL